MRTLDSELADSGYAPKFIDALASARRAAGRLATAGEDVHRDTAVTGLKRRVHEAPERAGGADRDGRDLVGSAVRQSTTARTASNYRGAGVLVGRHVQSPIKK
ncbi:hypothetical protein GCM10009733_096280 [Nonomuraea maheshkhaliensis]|uniref:Uncharacterized protein n=1 Tax=Nonomuraea maheshkhaliensis TaxID=419590 RepID=A0ABN2HA34_9ACTN